MEGQTDTQPPDRNEKVSLEFRLPTELREDVEELAWENRTSMSAVLRAFVRHGVENADEILNESEEVEA